MSQDDPCPARMKRACPSLRGTVLEWPVGAREPDGVAGGWTGTPRDQWRALCRASVAEEGCARVGTRVITLGCRGQWADGRGGWAASGRPLAIFLKKEDRWVTCMLSLGPQVTASPPSMAAPPDPQFVLRGTQSAVHALHFYGGAQGQGHPLLLSG